MKWVIFLSALLNANSGLAKAHACARLFPVMLLQSGKNTKASQDFKGDEWAQHKADEKIGPKFLKWLVSNKNGNYLEFVIARTKEKPLPSYIDVKNTVRLHDNHHEFNSYAIKNGGSDNFKAWHRIDRDYTQANPATGKKWKKKEMMADLIERRYVAFRDKTKPTYEDLENLPRITKLKDYPERSAVSFALLELDIPIKGSYFGSQFQKIFIEELRTQGIEIFEGEPFGKANISRLAGEIQTNKATLSLMKSELDQNLKPALRQKIIDFLESQLEALEQPPEAAE